MMTEISGKLWNADGTAANGAAVISWLAFQAHEITIVGGQKVVEIVEGDFVTTLYPNVSAQPKGLYYTVRMELDSGAVYEEFWIVPDVPAASIEQVRSSFPLEPGMAVNTSQIAGSGAVPGQLLTWNGSSWVPGFAQVENINPNWIRLDVGAAGNDVNITGSPVSLGKGATINIPDASPTARGVVTTGAQSFAGNKTFAGGVLVEGALTGPTITDLYNKVGSAQTPWKQNIDAARFDLNNVGVVRFKDYVGTSPLMVGVGNENGTLHFLTDNGGSIDIESIGNGRVLISTDSTRRLVVHQGGNVGIGPSMNPSYKLDVQGDVNSTGVYRINGVPHTHAASEVTSGVFATARLGTGTADATTYLRGDGTWQVVSAGGGGSQTPWTQNIDGGGFELRNAGNIGIGTAGIPLSTPVAGRSYLTIRGSSDISVLELATGAADADGSVIGQFVWTDPANTQPDKRVALIYVARSGSTAGNRGSILAFLTRPDNGSIWAERMRIDNAGRVGIGTATPQAGLDVASTIRAIERVSGAPASGAGVEVTYAGATGYVIAYDRTAGAYKSLNITGDPLVMGGPTYTAFSQGGAERMRIDSTGRVGIGKTPAYPLDVAGDCNITGVYRVNGTPISTWTQDANANGFNLLNAGSVRISGPAGTDRALWLATNGVARWLVSANSQAETGTSPTGSDFAIYRCADDGSFLATALLIKRDSGGYATFGGALQAGRGIVTTGSMQGALASSACLDFFSGTARIMCSGADASTYGAFQIVQVSSNQSLVRYPVVIDTAGKVGIGGSPQTGYVGLKLDVRGDSTCKSSLLEAQLQISGLTNSAKKLGLGFDTTSNAGMIWSLEAGVAMRWLHINPGGYVSIGSDVNVLSFSDMPNSSTAIQIDTGNNKLVFFVKYSNGTMKTAQLALA